LSITTKEAGSEQTAYVFDLQIMPTQAYRKLTFEEIAGAVITGMTGNKNYPNGPGD